MLCPECGVPGESDPQLSRWLCRKCGNAFFLRRCSACVRVSYVDGLQGFHMPWPCTWCGQFNTGFSQNRDPAAASATELAAELASHGLPHRPAEDSDADAVRSAKAPRSSAKAGPTGVRPREPLWPSVAEVAPGSAEAGPGGMSARMPTWPGVAEAAPGRSEAAPWPRRRSVRRVVLLMTLAGACAAAAFALVAARSPMAAGMATRPGVGAERAVHVAVGPVGGIDFQGVAGQLTIVGTPSGQVALTGQVHGATSAPAVETRFDREANVLRVSIQCAAGSPCTENLRLAVPAGTRTVVSQPSGQIVAADLSAPLSITAENVDISASGLRSTDFAAVITSGHLSAAFAAPPRRVVIRLASAQATIHLPGQVPYRVTQRVMSGYIDVAIPQAGSAPRAVTARIDSGELELLSS